MKIRKEMKLALACSDMESARNYAMTQEGVVFYSTSEATSHLPFAALILVATDNLLDAFKVADVGTYLVCERTIKNKPLAELTEEELPGSVGIFPMVANPNLGIQASDNHWRDNHAPLALEVHTTMTHYYQLAVAHRFSGPDWHGIAACCCATEDNLRNHFYGSNEGERRIIEDIQRFADTRRSPRRVIAKMASALT